MNKGRSIRNMALGLAVAFAVCGVLPVDAKTDVRNGRRIVIVHTNDLHGNLGPDDKGRGGLTKIATELNKIRQENPDEVIYLDAGDVAQGTAISNFFHGEPMYSALKYMSPVCGTLGNHEWDWGTQVTDNIVTKAGYPIIAANIVDGNTGRNLFTPYKIVRVNGVKVGIIGFVTPTVPDVVKKGNTGNYKFLDPVEVAKQYVPRMHNAGAHLIVALTHCGVDEDKVLAAAHTGIDIIVGGHSHTKLDKALDVDGVKIMQSDKYGRHLGVVEMLVNPGTGRIMEFDNHLIEINSKLNLEDDPAVKAIYDKYNEKIKPIMEQEIGKNASDALKKPASGFFDGPLGNMLCDAMRAKTGADVAVYNYGGIRDDVLAGGVVKTGTIFKILPFDDQIVTVKMTGALLQELMDQAVNVKLGYLQSSGMTGTIDMGARKCIDLKINGKPIDPAQTYTVATSEFLSGGQDGYTVLAKATLVDRFDVFRDVVMDYFKEAESREAAPSGRFPIINLGK